MGDTKIQIWDTAGQERFADMLPMYYRSADLAMIVYDITCAESFESAKHKVIKIHQEQEKTKIVLIGNKCDLAQHRQVYKQDVI